jgi:hypothetical protein
MRAALALLLIASPAWSQTLMTAEEFEAWSTGQTLDYTTDGFHWSSEMHLLGRRTLLSNGVDQCLEGIWFPKDDAICFVYDGLDTEYCWHFWRDGSDVFAEMIDTPGEPTDHVTLAAEPLTCPGPDVGV